MATKTYFGGGTFSSQEMRRVQRLFRAHVQMPSNPMGRIVRQTCYFCRLTAMRGGYPHLEHLPPAPAHHVDYAHPFKVVWCCDSHHRQIDHGALRLPLKAICDYTSLIEAPGVAKKGLRRAARVVRPAEDCPFGDDAPPQKERVVLTFKQVAK